MGRRWWRTPILIYPLLGAFLWSVLELWRFPEVWAQEPPPRPSRPANRPATKFTDNLKDLRRLAKQAAEAQARGGDLAPAMAALRQARHALREADRTIRAEYAATEQKLRQANLPPEILQRHADAVAAYNAKHHELESHFSEAEDAHGRIADPWNFEDRAPEHARLKDRLKRAQEFLERHLPKVTHRPLDPNKLPHRPVQPRWKAPRTSSRILPTYALPGSAWLAAQEELDPAYVTQLAVAGDTLIAQVLPKGSSLPTTPMAADLAPTEDVQITQEIRDLAAQLGNDPVKIYEYVRNTIDFEPTWGSIKGSVLTLWERSGNAFDTASLLIALLRAAGIPARYVLGTIQVPAAAAQNWVGGVATPQFAATILASGGVPVSYSATHVTLEHTWVEAYVPFSHYRGVPLGQTGRSWIPLDSSFKQFDYQVPPNLSKLIPFDRVAYLAASPSQISPVDAHWIQMRDYLDANDPGKTPDDFKRTRQIRAQSLGLLPASLPARVLALTGEGVGIPEVLRHLVRIEISDAITPGLTLSASLPSLLGKRLTVSYIPATTADENLIADYGALWNVPPYLLRLRPVMKLDGTAMASGAEIGAGQTQMISVTLLQPGGVSDTVQHDLLAGGYYALGLGPKGRMERLLAERFRRYTETVPRDYPDQYNDPLLGEFLYLMALRYFERLEAAESELSQLHHYTYGRDPGELLTGYEVQVAETLGVPLGFQPELYTYKLDVARVPLVTFAADGDESRRVAIVQQRGLTTSFLEHHTSELMTSLPSGSAVKVIQLANQAGIPLRLVDATNLTQILPILSLPEDVKARVADAVAQGRVVTIPEGEITSFNWTGVGWLSEDPQTGGGAYIISDDLRGGVSWYQRDGQNPACDFLEARLGGEYNDVFKAIAYQESQWGQYAIKGDEKRGPKDKQGQYINKQAQPSTSGVAFGVMQIHQSWNPDDPENKKRNLIRRNPITNEVINWEEVLWSWQYNVDLGRAIFFYNLERAREYSDREGLNLNPEQLIESALSYYLVNRTPLYRKVDGSPVRNEHPGAKYADEVNQHRSQKPWRSSDRKNKLRCEWLSFP